MKHLAFIFGMAALMAVSCSVREESFNAPDANAPVFRATFEQPADAGTKVFVNEDFLLRWNADDRVSLFNKTTANQQYRFLGVTGDSEGEFEIVGEPGTGAAIPYVISVYPYQESTDPVRHLRLSLPGIHRDHRGRRPGGHPARHAGLRPAFLRPRRQYDGRPFRR